MKPTIHHYRTQYSEERRCTVNPQPKETDMSTQQTLNTLAQTSPEAWRTTAGPLTMRWAREKGMLITRWVKTEPSKGARRAA